MKLGRILTGTILVIGVGLALSGCVAEPVGYGPAGGETLRHIVDFKTHLDFSTRQVSAFSI